MKGEGHCDSQSARYLTPSPIHLSAAQQQIARKPSGLNNAQQLHHPRAQSGGPGAAGPRGSASGLGHWGSFTFSSREPLRTLPSPTAGDGERGGDREKEKGGDREGRRREGESAAVCDVTSRVTPRLLPSAPGTLGYSGCRGEHQELGAFGDPLGGCPAQSPEVLGCK